MDWYITLVKAHPILMAMAQFAVLGTFGDIISKCVISKKVHLPFTIPVTIMKMIEWALLAICIKYAFVGFNGFVDALSAHNMLPTVLGKWSRAFAISSTMNLQFGPFLVIAHRILDNAISRENNWDNIDKGMKSLIWFWIPAHTVTFVLPKPYQIGLAAIWSVVLGVILGFYNRKPFVNEEN